MSDTNTMSKMDNNPWSFHWTVEGGGGDLSVSCEEWDRDGRQRCSGGCCGGPALVPVNDQVESWWKGEGTALHVGNCGS